MHKSDSEIVYINVEQVIASKSAIMAKYMPKFVINFIRRLIHEEELNRILKDNNRYEGIEFSQKCLEWLNVSVDVKYTCKETLDSNKRYIFVSNHPLGGLDGLALISVFGGIFGDIKFVVNDFLMHIKPLESIFIPVNKVGGMTKDYAKKIDDLYLSNSQILYFPAGLCSRLIGGVITDLPWHPNFYKKAVASGREIVPIFFSGRNSMFFYRFAKLRKALKIKFNFDMMLLPNELFKQKNATFSITIGEPIRVEQWKNNSELIQKSTLIREKVYSLQNK